MKQTQIQIINGDDFWQQMETMVAGVVSQAIPKYLGLEYITSDQALKILGKGKSHKILTRLVEVGKRDQLGRYHKLTKHYPDGNSKPMYRLEEVMAIRNIK